MARRPRARQRGGAFMTGKSRASAPGTYASALVLGLGASGADAARLLRREGSAVTVIDRGRNSGLAAAAKALEAEGVRVMLGRDAPPDSAYSVCIASPGIPAESPLLRTLRARSVPVLPEFELGWSRLRSRVVAVTGSNGKSTLVKLCTEALLLAGARAAQCGNCMPTVCRIALEQDERPLDWAVMELSSFQLELAAAFKPEVAVLLNLQPNHLDRHADMHAYRAAKARLFARMSSPDRAIVWEHEKEHMAALAASAPDWITFGLSESADYRYVEGGVSVRAARHAAPLPIALPTRGTIFDNEIMGPAAAAAMAVADACGAGAAALSGAMRDFKPLPHRMTEIAVLRGVRFVDDSKATNLAALAAAVRMTRGPVRLIAGGLEKNEPFDPVRPLLAGKVAAAYLIGKAAPLLSAAWRDATACALCGNIEEAVRRAFAEAAPGDTVLLAPGCASFDQFRNFGERGDRFAALVRGLCI